MSPSLKFYAYLHSSAIATLLCTFLITACADPVRDAIKTAEKFAAANDFTEALRILDRTPFKTPEEKQRIADARVRVVRAQKVVYIEEVLKSVELEPRFPLGGPFYGLAWEQQYFTPELAFRYNNLVMRYNVPVKLCEAERKTRPLLLCANPMAYLNGGALLEDMLVRARRAAERGDMVGMHCRHFFVWGTLIGSTGQQAEAGRIAKDISAAEKVLQAKLKATDSEFTEQRDGAQRACTPDVVFKKERE